MRPKCARGTRPTRPTRPLTSRPASCSSRARPGPMKRNIAWFFVVACAVCSLCGLGCSKPFIPNTDVEDNGENREVIVFCEKYRHALEDKNVAELLKLMSPALLRGRRQHEGRGRRRLRQDPRLSHGRLPADDRHPLRDPLPAPHLHRDEPHLRRLHVRGGVEAPRRQDRRVAPQGRRQPARPGARRRVVQDRRGM